MKLFLRRAEAALVFFISFALAALVIRYKPQVESTLRSVGPLVAYPLAIGIFTIVASAPFSVTDALAVMNGVIFGPLWGSIVNAVGLVCAALVGYAVALRTSSLLDLDTNLKKLPGWVTRFKVGSPAFLITARIIPGLGGTLATQVAAAMRVNIWTHVWTMCAIAVPVCTLLAIFGDRIAEAVHGYYEAHKLGVQHMPEHLRNMLHHVPATNGHP